ncbi:hypothetical protein [Sphingomonas sp. YL-JM2C]
MDDYLQDEMRKLIAAALTDDPQVDRVTNGARSTELNIWFKDGRFRVVSLHVRESI